uniref:Uncharacterized protein n=1 Tax=Cacopsylla melanoneura TaxID=428564 RepID=A0A8D8TW06_9HEMI
MKLQCPIYFRDIPRLSDIVRYTVIYSVENLTFICLPKILDLLYILILKVDLNKIDLYSCEISVQNPMFPSLGTYSLSGQWYPMHSPRPLFLEGNAWEMCGRWERQWYL